MSDPDARTAARTRSLDLDPLGAATRGRAEIKLTGAQLMDIIEERDANAARAAALEAALRALVEADEVFAAGDPDGYCVELHAAREVLAAASPDSEPGDGKGSDE